MTRHVRTCLIVTLIALVPAAGGAETTRKGFAGRVHKALAADGVTSAEIADGTIACDDLSPEVTSGCGGPGSVGGAPAATNVFIDGTRQLDRDLPTTPSANNDGASIATLELDEGSHVVFASLVWSANPTNFAGIVTCLLVPPNQGPVAKAEFIGSGTAVGTLFAQTTAVGPGVVDFRCTTGDQGSRVQYRFLQLTEIRVGSLTSTKLP